MPIDYCQLMVKTRDELRDRCRSGELSPAGTKRELAYRILAAPDGNPAKESTFDDCWDKRLLALSESERLRLMQDAPPVPCAVFGCENAEPELPKDRNIKCWVCHNMICSCCTTKIWKGEWSDQTFPKPKVMGGITHEVFTCPFCRSSFYRMIPTSQ